MNNLIGAFTSVALALLVCSSNTAQAQSPMINDGGQVTTSAGEAVNGTWKPSLVRDGVYDRVPHVRRIIPWQPIRENDILWKKRIWREIDTREKQNMAFRYAGDENTGGGYFIEILLDAVKNGKLKAYTPFDDRFVASLSKDQIMESLAGKTDTFEVIDPITGEPTTTYRRRDFNPELITKYRMKEDWIFDRNLGRMVVRIIGVAPVRDIYDDDNNYRGTQPMFWLYYPEAREVLAQYEVYNPQNDVARMTWDDFFENRMFASRITKVSNNFGAEITTTADNNPMRALYQGQQVQEEIFNKEHDMWVY